MVQQAAFPAGRSAGDRPLHGVGHSAARRCCWGRLRKHDPLTDEADRGLSRRPGPPNHWSEAWIDLQLGLALAAGGREGRRCPSCSGPSLAAGEFDHPLTSMALLELGRLALMRGDYPAAAKYFEEATYAAVHYPDSGVLEEAFRYGALTHLLANAQGAVSAAGRGHPMGQEPRVSGSLHASLLLMAAEN